MLKVKLIRHILIFFSVFLKLSVFGEVQNKSFVADSNNFSQIIIVNKKDTVKKDSSKNSFNEESFEYDIDYTAKDSIIPYFETGIIDLYGEAKVNYGDINIDAYHIKIDKVHNEIYAEGDINGKDQPIFNQGKDTYLSKTMKYNFKTKKGSIKEVFTKQQDGYMQGEISKRHENEEIHICNGKYTTCPYQEHPHFYFHLMRAKMIPDDKIVFDRAYLVVADIPLPLGLPFGFFPFTKKAKNGLLFPSFGQDYNKGLYLRNFGWYFPINYYIDLKLQGSYYTRGSSEYNIQSTFNKLYKFNGNFNFQYNKNVIGDESSLDYEKREDYSLNFDYNQDPKANPNSVLMARVAFRTSNFSKNNIKEQYDANKRLNSSAQSAMRYTRKGDWGNYEISINADQALSEKTTTLILPSFSYNSKDIYPFQLGKQSINPTWYEKINTKLSVFGTNKANLKEKELLNDFNLNKYYNGLMYSFPLSTSINFLKFFTTSFSFNYDGVVMTKKIKKNYNAVQDTIITDTLQGLYHAYNIGPMTGLRFAPEIYIMYNFIEGLKVNAIRHVISPSISLSYKPNIGLDEKEYKDKVAITTFLNPKVQTYQEYDMYSGVNAYGPPSRSSDESASLSFSLKNNIEMKVNDGYDDKGQPKTKKIPILSALDFLSGWNLMADSCNMSIIQTNARTKILGADVNLSAGFQPYAVDEQGRISRHFEWSKNRIPARFIGTSFSYNLTLNNSKVIKFWETVGALISGKPIDKNKDEKNDTQKNDELSPITTSNTTTNNKKDDKKSVGFTMPWDFSAAYTVNISNVYDKNKKDYELKYALSLGFNGNLTLTKNTKINFTSGFNFEKKEINVLFINLTRDMHCWAATFSWIPLGYRSFNFNLSIKSSMLKDTFKYDANRNDIVAF